MSNSSSQDFLFRHFEKFIFGVLVCLALFLIYRGFQMPNFLDEQQPDRMEQGANQVKTAIDEDHWESINTAESRLVSIDVVARTNESIRPVSSQLYRLNHPWEGKSIDASLKRVDPPLASPIDVMVTGVIASIAVKLPPSKDPLKQSDYPLKALDNAEPIVVKAPEPKKPPKRVRRPMMDGSGMEGMMMEGSGMEGMMMEGMPGMEGMGSAGMEGMMGMGGPGGMAGVGMKPARQIDAKKFDQGFRPMQNGNFEPAIGHFISGVALMPHKELFKAYQDAFQQADGYNPLRDQPVYIGFSLQRADVTNKPVDQLADGDWVTRFTSKNIQQLLLNYWAGMAKEVVAGKYRDPELTSAIPPVLLKNYLAFVSHPKIPLGDEDLTRKNPALLDTAPVGPIIPTVGDDPFSGANIGTAQPGVGMMGSAGMMGGSGMMGGGYSMEGSGSGMDGGYGMGGFGGAGGYGMNAPSIDNQPDHKLIRFYDFRDFTGADKTAPIPGRKYVYRIRVAIEDPNFPRNASLQPRNSTLSAEVFRRVEQETAKANTGKKVRNSIRWSEFSAPSPVVSLPPMSGMYAGPVVPAQVRKIPVEGKEIEVTQKPPSGKLVATKWDPTYKVPVPIVMDVVRGTILSRKGDAEVPDPYGMLVKKLPEADINTHSVVLDLDGGQRLAISQDENQTEPGVVLLFGPDGGLQVSDEISSQLDYQFYSFSE
ncbi:MAG TPA: hypothetical protein DDZ51_16330 [Planctomycetaceae bacterium]|nr:hypothetical protein [Planctomycetaceae bacterium]